MPPDLAKVVEALKRIHATLSNNKIAHLTINNGFTELVAKYKGEPWMLTSRVHIYALEMGFGISQQPTLLAYVPDLDKCVTLNVPGDVMSIEFVEETEQYNEKLALYKEQLANDPKVVKLEKIFETIRRLSKSEVMNERLLAIVLGGCLSGMEQSTMWNEEIEAMAQKIMRQLENANELEAKQVFAELWKDHCEYIKQRNEMLEAMRTSLQIRQSLN